MPADIMVDLETLGSVPGCAMLSIGAVVFDATQGALGDDFYCVVDRASCAEAGLHECGDTLAWWGKQSLDARDVIDQARGPLARPLREALEDFNAFVLRQSRAARVWGNGADFDNAILSAAFRSVGMKPAWPFWQNRCYRTLKGLHPGIKLDRIGVHHNALDDAKVQARHAMRILVPGLL